MLVNVDILERIFSFFDPAFFDDTWDIDRKTRKYLLSAALTYKPFFEPAMNLLWKTMESIIPFLKILPEFVKAEDIYVSLFLFLEHKNLIMAIIQTIREEILPHHRDRFNMYGRKVRYLYLKSFQELVRGHAIALLQSISDSNQNLFPGLKMIYIPAFEVTGYPRNLECLNILFLALSSSLVTVSLGGINTSSDEFAASFLSILSQRASSLQELILGGRLSPNSLKLVSKFSKLEVLSISGQNSVLQTSFLERCSVLENLTHLSVNLDASSTFSISDLTPYLSGFAALQALQLGGSPVELSKVLQSIAPPSLESITITCSSSSRHQPPESESVALCIQECGRISPTYRIQLRFGGAGRNPTIVSDRSLSSLQSCKSLQILDISGITLHITDDIIRDLCDGGAWRSLRYLHLPPSESEHSPSLSSLKILARNCPDLQSLVISINFQNMPLLDFSVLPNERASRIPHSLKRLLILKVPDARIGETNTITVAISVSLFIEYHFPNLEKAKLSSDFSVDIDWWKSVEMMMKAYKMVREETISEMQTLTHV